MKDEALKLALEALTNAYWPTESDLMPAHNIKECAEAITAIKEALAQPEQHQDWCASLTQMLMSMPPKPAPCNCKPKPEYLAFMDTPQRKPLSDEEILTYRYMIDWTAEWSYINFARAIEAAHGIKEKNT